MSKEVSLFWIDMIRDYILLQLNTERYVQTIALDKLSDFGIPKLMSY